MVEGDREMRSREEIKDELLKSFMGQSKDNTIIEVLLDIRDLLSEVRELKKKQMQEYVATIMSNKTLFKTTSGGENE